MSFINNIMVLNIFFKIIYYKIRYFISKKTFIHLALDVVS